MLLRENDYLRKRVAELEAQQSSLREAVCDVYYAARWSADRPVDEVALWTNLRDAAGLEPGGSPKPITREDDKAVPSSLREKIEALDCDLVHHDGINDETGETFCAGDPGGCFKRDVLALLSDTETP